MAQENWNQVREIFVDAMRRSPAERDRFIEHACSDNESLRNEVDSLLSSYDSAESFMETPAAVEVADAFEAPPVLAAGQRLKHYQIVRQIGGGGMGEVYLAQDTKLHRKIALKVLHSELSSDKNANERLLREARAAATLEHPNICAIHEIAETEDYSFIVMQHLEGETLSEKLGKGPISIETSLDLAIQIADALDEAHTHHIIHRDIKPANIIVNNKNQAKVLDFGLAKMIQAESEGETAKMLSGSGAIMGTAPYMSPEQLRGKTLDTRTDIFSFGVMLYEMLSGEQPFSKKDSAQTIAAILKSEPPQLSSHNPEIPDWLGRIVAKCLCKDREERYQNTKDLFKDLKEVKHEYKSGDGINPTAEPTGFRNVQTDESKIITDPDSMVPVSSAEYITSGIRGHKYVAFSGLAALVIALAAYGYFGFFADVGDQIESIAVMPFINASGDKEVEYLSDGMAETLISSLSRIPTLSVKARSSVILYKGKEVSPQQIGKELNVQAVLSGRVLQRGEDLSLSLELVDARTENILWSEKYDRQMSNLVALQTLIAREVSNKLRIELTSAEQEQIAKTYTKNSEAQKLYLQGRFHWNKRNKRKPGEFEKAIEYFKQAIEKDPNHALAYSGLADVYHLMPMYAGARPHEYMPLAKKAALKALELDDNLAEAHASHGEVLLFYDYDWEGAEREYKRAIELDPKYATVHHWYAHLLNNKGMHDEAIKEMSKAVELEPSSEFFKLKMGTIFNFARRYDDAIAQYKKVIKQNPGSVRAIGGLILAYEAKEMYPEAYEQFLILMRKRKSKPESIQRFKDLYEKGGWKGFKRVRIENSFKVRKARLEKDPTAYIRSRLVANDYADLKDKERTLEYLSKAFEERDYWLVFLKGEYRFDFVRDDPRFKELVKKVGIPD